MTWLRHVSHHIPPRRIHQLPGAGRHVTAHHRPLLHNSNQHFTLGLKKKGFSYEAVPNCKGRKRSPNDPLR